MEVTDSDALQRPFLEGNDQEEPIGTNVPSPDQPCCPTSIEKEIPVLFAIAIVSWLGFVSTIVALYACDFIHIAWDRNSMHLSITGVGIRRFQQILPKPSQGIEEVQCLDQNSFTRHSEISKQEHFFPESHFLQTMSVLAPTLAGVVMSVVIVVLVVASTSPEKFHRTLNRQYPWNAMIAYYLVLGLILIAAGTAELLVILHLLHVKNPGSDAYDSPICNRQYSTCQLGMGGKIAAAGVACCYAGGLVAIFAAMVTMRARRTT